MKILGIGNAIVDVLCKVSNDFLIFVLQGKKKIIAYAILVKKVEKLISIFSDMKIMVFNTVPIIFLYF